MAYTTFCPHPELAIAGKSHITILIIQIYIYDHKAQMNALNFPSIFSQKIPIFPIATISHTVSLLHTSKIPPHPHSRLMALPHVIKNKEAIQREPSYLSTSTSAQLHSSAPVLCLLSCYDEWMVLCLRPWLLLYILFPLLQQSFLLLPFSSASPSLSLQELLNCSPFKKPLPNIHPLFCSTTFYFMARIKRCPHLLFHFTSLICFHSVTIGF